MALFENFPYTNIHELNLDWIVKIAKDFLEQYTHIQQLITDGETSLTNLTETGLASLQDKTDTGIEELQTKADNLEAALQSWYDTHSEDIAQELADALADLNAWYTQHEGYLDQYVTESIQSFGAEATRIAHETIETIPEDYTNLSTKVDEIGFEADQEMVLLLPDAMESTYHYQYLKTANKKDGFYNRQSKAISNSTTASYFPPFRIIKGQAYTFYHVYGYFCTIFYDDETVQSLSDETWPATDYRITSAPDNGWAYVCITNTNINIAAVVWGTQHYNGESYYEGFLDFKLPKLKIPTLDTAIDQLEIVDNEVTDINKFIDTSFTYNYQYLSISESENHKYWDGTVGSQIAKGGNQTINTRAYNRVLLKPGVTYTFRNVYRYFTIITDLTNIVIRRLVDDQNPAPYTGTFTPDSACYAYVTKHTGYEVDTMLINSETIPNHYIEGPYDMDFTNPKNIDSIDIHVKQDGSGDYTSIVEAVSWANTQSGNYPINIYIYTGDYNILDELGGNDFISHIEDSPSERQGLSLNRNNVNLIGVGYVIMRFEMPDTVTEIQSERVSCLNMREYSNTVKNITLIAKNCRYVVHDEAQGVGTNIVRVCENLRCIHKGNVDGLWRWMTVWGGGTAKSGTYTFINCQFLTSVYHQAWSYHSNRNTESLFFNVDGCIGSVKTSAPTKRSFALSYYGTGRIGIETGNIKNCSGNGDCVVVPESGSTGNNIEMYVNGWNTIAEIPVTGNE